MYNFFQITMPFFGLINKNKSTSEKEEPVTYL